MGQRIRYRKPRHILFRIVQGDVIILNTETDTYYALENVGARIWHQLLKGKSIQLIIKEIQKEYNLRTEKRVKKDTMDLVKDLLKEGLLEPRKP
jgi:hypothetical protein